MAKKKSKQHENRIREEHLIDKLFLLHLKKSLFVIIAWIAFLILAENYDGFYETLALWVVPIYLLISVIYTLSKHKRIEGKRR